MGERKAESVSIKKLQYISEILSEQINHWTLFPFIVTVTGVAATIMDGIDTPNILMWVLCGLYPLAFFILRERAKHFTVFLFLHIAVAASSFLLPVRNLMERSIIVFFIVCYFIYSFTRFFRDSNNFTEPVSPIISLAVSVITIILQNFQGQSNWDAIYVVNLVGVMALFAINKYISNYLDFLTVNESSASTMPMADMFHSGMGLISGYTLFGAVFLLLLGGDGWAATLRDWLRSLLLWIARGFFYLLGLLFSAEEQEEIMEVPQETASGGFDGGLPEAGEPFFLWKILEVALYIVLLGLLLFLAAKGTLAIIRLIRRRFAEITGRKTEDVLKDEIDIREKCEIDKSRERKEKKSALLFLSPEERVRRLYKKKVLSSAFELTGSTEEKEIGKLGILTARECADKLQTWEFADIYEQTRYSCHEITRETVREMKNACRG